MTHYEVLGVAPDATRDQIKEAYRRLARLTHPDKSDDNEDRFVEIDRAWKVLQDEGSRKRYDAEELRRTYVDESVVYARLVREGLDFRDGTAEYPCRCGQTYVIDERDLDGSEMLVVQCDECSYVITVTNK